MQCRKSYIVDKDTNSIELLARKTSRSNSISSASHNNLMESDSEVLLDSSPSKIINSTEMNELPLSSSAQTSFLESNLFCFIFAYVILSAAMVVLSYKTSIMEEYRLEMGWSFGLAIGLSILAVLLIGFGTFNETVMFFVFLEGEKQILKGEDGSFSINEEMSFDMQVFYVLISILDLLLVSVGLCLLPKSIGWSVLAFSRYFLVSFGCSADFIRNLPFLKLELADMARRDTSELAKLHNKTQRDDTTVYKHHNYGDDTNSGNQDHYCCKNPTYRRKNETFRATSTSEFAGTPVDRTHRTWSRIILSQILIILVLAVAQTYYASHYFGTNEQFNPLALFDLPSERRIGFLFFWGAPALGISISVFLAKSLLAQLQLQTKNDQRYFCEQYAKTFQPEGPKVTNGIGLDSPVTTPHKSTNPGVSSNPIDISSEARRCAQQILQLGYRDNKLRTSDKWWKYLAFLAWGLYMVSYRTVYGVVLATWPKFVKFNSTQENLLLDNQMVAENGFEVFISQKFLAFLAIFLIVTVILFTVKVSNIEDGQNEKMDEFRWNSLHISACLPGD